MFEKVGLTVEREVQVEGIMERMKEESGVDYSSIPRWPFDL